MSNRCQRKIVSGVTIVGTAESVATEPVSVHGQPTAFVIRETYPAAKMGAEDAILFNQIRNARLPLVRPPAGHGHHEESNRGEIHDAGVYISDSSLVSEGRLRIGTLLAVSGTAKASAIRVKCLSEKF